MGVALTPSRNRACQWRHILILLLVSTFQTALAGATLESLGRASKGIVKKALVISDKKLAKNLASIPKLDRLGYTTTFCNGKGVVTDRQGNIVTSAQLTDDDLYEFDIRELFEAEHAQLRRK